MKQIQIPEALFMSLCRHHLFGQDQSDIIRQGLQAKLNAAIRHDLYSTYKSAKTEEERETARKKYLDEKGIPEEFRW